MKTDLARAASGTSAPPTRATSRPCTTSPCLSAGRQTGTPDYATAAQWFTEAAERGLCGQPVQSRRALRSGLGVQKDLKQPTSGSPLPPAPRSQHGKAPRAGPRAASVRRNGCGRDHAPRLDLEAARDDDERRPHRWRGLEAARGATGAAFAERWLISAPDSLNERTGVSKGAPVAVSKSIPFSRKIARGVGHRPPIS